MVRGVPCPPGAEIHNAGKAMIMGEKINVPMWAAEIAAELGDGWSVPVGHSHETGAAIVHTDGRRIYAYVKAYGGTAWDKAEISGSYPMVQGERADEFEPLGSPDRISVSTRRDPKAVARDITRRFLTDYAIAYSEGLALKAAHEKAVVNRDKVMADIIATNPTDLREYRTGEVNWSPDGPGFGDIIVSHGGSCEVHLRSLTAEQVIKVMRALSSDV